MLNDARVASACLYVRTCRRVRNSKNIATIRDFHLPSSFFCLSTRLKRSTLISRTMGDLTTEPELLNSSVPLITAETHLNNETQQWMIYFVMASQLLIWIYGTFCMFCNALFIGIIVWSPRLHTTFNILAATLAIRNFVGSSFVMPTFYFFTKQYFYDQSLESTRILCKVVTLFIVMLKFYTIVVMIMINIIVCVSVAYYCVFYRRISLCEPLQHALSKLTSFLLITLIIGYVVVTVATYKRSAAMRRSRNHRFEVATLRASLIIVISYLLSHLPEICSTGLFLLGVITEPTAEVRFCVVIAMFTTVFDSFILMVSSSDYRTHVLLFLRNKPTRKPKRPTVYHISNNPTRGSTLTAYAQRGSRHKVPFAVTRHICIDVLPRIFGFTMFTEDLLF